MVRIAALIAAISMMVLAFGTTAGSTSVIPGPQQQSVETMCVPGVGTQSVTGPLADILKFAFAHHVTVFFHRFSNGTTIFSVIKLSNADVQVSEGACFTPVAGVPTSSSFICQTNDDNEEPELWPASVLALLLKLPGNHQPVAISGWATPTGTGFTAFAHPTNIGTATHPYHIVCGEKEGGKWWVNTNGDLTNAKEVDNTPGWFGLI